MYLFLRVYMYLLYILGIRGVYYTFILGHSPHHKKCANIIFFNTVLNINGYTETCLYLQNRFVTKAAHAIKSCFVVDK